MYYPKLSGPTVYLSPVNPEDTKRYTRWMNDPEVTLGLGNHDRVYSEIAEQTLLENWAQNTSEISFAIIHKADDQLIGNCGLMDINPIHRRATLGIFIGEPELHSRGLGTEAMALLIDYGFRVLNLHNIELRYFSFNRRAERAYQKLGFQESGRRREAFCYNGRYYDEISMDILENEFRAGRYGDIGELETSYDL